VSGPVKDREAWLRLADARRGREGRRLYAMDLSTWTSTHQMAVFHCPEHGAFRRAPHGYLTGKGCPSCAQTGFDPGKPAELYLLWSEGVANFGITRDADRRRVQHNNDDATSYRFLRRVRFESGREAQITERRLLLMARASGYTPEPRSFEKFRLSARDACTLFDLAVTASTP